uniref:Protein TIME FOR COFFEE n=1 Tax=Noccaea caerulescens TaxID=107243 RepID=A0A1J3DJH4_NOCCA
MDKTREARRSTMATSDGVTKRRRRISENSRGQMYQEVATVRDRPEKKGRDPESLNRSKRRRSERFAPRNERDVEEDSSDESLGDDDVQHNYHRNRFPSGRIPRHAASLKVADEMIGVPVPRKARSACIKRSHECRTSSGSGGGGFGEDRRRLPASPGSYSFEVVSPSSSTVSVKQKKKANGSKSRIPKPPKSSGTIEDDLEIEIAEVLSGLKKHPHSSKREDESENYLKSSEVKGVKKSKSEADESSAGLDIGGLITCKARIETGNVDKSTNGTKLSSVISGIQKEKEERQETPSLLEKQWLDSRDSAVSKGISEGPQLENNKKEIDLMVPPTMPSSPERVTKDYCKQDSSVNNKKKIFVKNEMTPEEVKQKVEKREWLNLDLDRLSQETGRDSSLRLRNLDWSQPHNAKSAQPSSVLPLPVPIGCVVLPLQGYVPIIQNGKPVDGNSGSSTSVQGAPFSAAQPRPKRCATHFFIARNIQLHQHFVQTNNLSQPNKGPVCLKGGDLRPAAGNPSLLGSSSTLSLNSEAQDRITVNISTSKDKASETGHFASIRQKKPQSPPACSSTVPAQAFIFPSNHQLQPVMVPSKSPHATKNQCVAFGSASDNLNHPSSLGSEASSPYLTVVPNNAYSFQLSSTIRGGTPGQQLPFFNGSFYSSQMFQPPQLLHKQSQVQRETKAASCSSSSHRQPQLQFSVNSSQKHRQQSQKSEVKLAGDNSDSRGSHTQKGGPYGQVMTAPIQPQNFSMSFASFGGGSAPANLNFSSNGYHIVSGPPVVLQKIHQASDSKIGGYHIVSGPPVVHQKSHQASISKIGGGSCSSNAEDPRKTLPGKPPAMMNGQTLVFDNPSRTLDFVSGTWPPPPAATTINGDPSVLTTQRQQSKTLSHSQAGSVPATSSQWNNLAASSLTSCNSLNIKQYQSRQQKRTHGQTQISFAAPSKSQPPTGRSDGSSSSASHGKAANPKASSNNSKALPLSPVFSSTAHAQEQTENSASGSTQKTSPVCGRNVPPIITSCPGHMSELKY